MVWVELEMPEHKLKESVRSKQLQQDQYRILELVHETYSDLKILKIHS